MKNELIKKGIIILGVLLVGVGICALTWFFPREYAARTSRPFSSNDIDSADNQTAVRPSQTDTILDDEKNLTEKERAFQRAKIALMSKWSEVQLARPSMQKMLEVIDSPEFLDLLEKDLTQRQWNDFMESQGVEIVREYPGLLHKVVPDVELADYEPVVRLKLAELFLTVEPVDLTDPVAAARQRRKVYLELGKEWTQTDMAAVAWFIETFGEDRDAAFRSDASNDNPAFIWMTDVQQNAASIVAAAEQARGDALEASAPAWDMSSVMESPPVLPYEMEETGPSTASPSTDTKHYDTAKRAAAAPIVNPEKGATDALPPLPEPPTGEDIETALREQFSPKRFERAMSTLERYGPEEGLRRLRESDPEVAKQIEKARYHNRQEDAQ